MNGRFVIWALAAATMLGAWAPGASAAMTSAQECTSWTTQFDKEIKTHANKAKAPAAKLERDQGVAECKSGNSTEGAKKLEQALNDIGIKPATK